MMEVDAIPVGTLRRHREQRGLTHLKLSRCRIAPAALREIARLPNLTVLDLWHSDVNDAGLAALSGLTGLRRLGLADTKAGDGAVAVLRHLTALERLSLAGTSASLQAVQHLRPALPDCLIEDAAGRTHYPWRLSQRDRIRDRQYHLTIWDDLLDILPSLYTL